MAVLLWQKEGRALGFEHWLFQKKKPPEIGWFFFGRVAQIRCPLHFLVYEFEPLQNDISLRDVIYGWHRMIYFHFVKI